MYTLWGKVLMISYESKFPPLGKNSTVFSYSQDPPKVLLRCFDPAVVMQEQKKGLPAQIAAGQARGSLSSCSGEEGGSCIPAALSSSWTHTEARAMACSRSGKRGEKRGPSAIWDCPQQAERALVQRSMCWDTELAEPSKGCSSASSTLGGVAQVG